MKLTANFEAAPRYLRNNTVSASISKLQALRRIGKVFINLRQFAVRTLLLVVNSTLATVWLRVKPFLRVKLPTKRPDNGGDATSVISWLQCVCTRQILERDKRLRNDEQVLIIYVVPKFLDLYASIVHCR